MKSIELFAGAGGMALGLEIAGFKTIGLVENNKFASQTLKKNKPNWNVINENIEKISELDLEKYFALKKGELDLLSGGAPCQSFSYAGKKLGLEDTRGTLFYHYARFLKKLQPKMFLFENVKGLLSHDKGKTYQIISEVFENEGYFIYKKILNANNFGVAQKRERLFIVGIRKDLFKKGYKFNFPKKHKYKPVLKDILLNCPLSQGASYSEKKKKIFELVPPGGNWKNIPVSIAKEYMKGTWDSKGGHTTTLRRMSFDEPMFTVMTSPSQKLTERCHPVETRPFTIRENARCQSFPDEWLFIGSIAEQYKQIGNAVPVLLAYEIGKEIKKTLKKQN
jgi:DNA (cytosine-5-)-methyltransferase